MLEDLRSILNQVSEAPDLDTVLNTIVESVQKAMDVDQCSIFLHDPVENKMVLTATRGLNPESVGVVKLAPHEGLVGLVAEQRRPLVVENASEHPQFKHFPITGEGRYSAFLGVPVMNLRNIVGILTVQNVGDRKFTDSEEAFLVTISAQLAGVVHGAVLDKHLHTAKISLTQSRIQGIPAAPGVAVGTPVLPSPLSDLNQVDDRIAEDVAEEENHFRLAITGVTTELLDAIERLKSTLPQETLDLFSTYIGLANDTLLVDKTITRIRSGQWAPAALRDSIFELSAMFESMDDELLRSRSEDVRAVGRRLLLQLQSETRHSIDYPDRCILVGTEVSVARMSEVPVDKLAGIVSFEGSSLSHAAILARSLGIPAVMGIGQLSPESLEATLLIVDGYQGRIFANPIAAVLTEYHRLEQEESDLKTMLQQKEGLPATTTDGISINFEANISMLGDVPSALHAGASGVGLYRSEFPFMIRESFPVEEEQTKVYRQILEAFSPNPVIMRTLDVGGDKPLPYFPIEDHNPFLGWRGIRVSLNHPEIFLTQIRAMLRASEGFTNLKIMLPMVSTVSEIDEAYFLIKQAHQELLDEGRHILMPSFGTMIEVPALLYQIPELARRVDFFSIGTNDLTQYLMASARDNPNVADLYDHFQPAVLRAISRAVKEASDANRGVSICGEFVSEPAGALLAIGMGVTSMSMSSASFAKIKWVVRSFAKEDARQFLNIALQCSDAQEVKKLAATVLEEAGLGGLIRAGK